jgi:hypothetical protein
VGFVVFAVVISLVHSGDREEYCYPFAVKKARDVVGGTGGDVEGRTLAGVAGGGGNNQTDGDMTYRGRKQCAKYGSKYGSVRLGFVG